MFDKATLKFEEEFTVNIPKEIPYNLLFESFKIAKSEYKERNKIDFKGDEDQDELKWVFESNIGKYRRMVFFEEIGDGKTKVKVKERIPDIESIFVKSTQEHVGESFLVSQKMFFKALEHVYHKGSFSEAGDNFGGAERNKPFYCKEYSETLGPDLELPPLYDFLKKRYELFDKVKNDYSTMKDKRKSIVQDRKVDHLKIKNLTEYGKATMDYSFQENNGTSSVKIRFWVPYWYMFSGLRRKEFKDTFRGLKTTVRAFDTVYKESMM